MVVVEDEVGAGRESHTYTSPFTPTFTLIPIEKDQQLKLGLKPTTFLL